MNRYERLADLYYHEYDQNSIEEPNYIEEDDPQFDIEYEEDEYEKKRRKIFKELSASILSSKCPYFEALVVTNAWNIQEEAAANGNKGKGRRLSLDKKFYVYVLMDPRKPGPWVITLFGGVSFDLPFLPFYVGKGFGRRMFHHTKDARNQPEPRQREHKLNLIRSLHTEGKEPIARRITNLTIDSVALAKEELLIAAIGRADKKEGPLTNATDGREGGSGVVGIKRSKEFRAALRKAHLGKPKSEEARANMSKAQRGKVKGPYTEEHCSNISKGLLRYKRTPKHNANNAAAQRASMNDEKRARQSEAQAKVPPQTCPHCGYTGRASIVQTWHLDKCKWKGVSTKERECLQRTGKPLGYKLKPNEFVCPYCPKILNRQWSHKHLANCKKELERKEETSV